MTTFMSIGKRLVTGTLLVASISGAIIMPSSPVYAAAATRANDVRTLQNDANDDLVALGMPRLTIDGQLGPQTLRAACTENWLATGVATRNAAVYTANKINELNTKDNLVNPYLSEHRTRVANGFIVNKTCQVMAVARNNTIVAVYPVSTGRSGHDTPNGLFTIFMGRNGWHNSSKYPTESGNGNMYDPLYFAAGGIALHGSNEMSNSSTTPQSHGCVRLTIPVADAVFRRQGGNTHAPQDAIVPVTHSTVVVTGKFGN